MKPRVIILHGLSGTYKSTILKSEKFSEAVVIRSTTSEHIRDIDTYLDDASYSCRLALAKLNQMRAIQIKPNQTYVFEKGMAEALFINQMLGSRVETLWADGVFSEKQVNELLYEEKHLFHNCAVDRYLLVNRNIDLITAMLNKKENFRETLSKSLEGYLEKQNMFMTFMLAHYPGVQILDVPPPDFLDYFIKTYIKI